MVWQLKSFIKGDVIAPGSVASLALKMAATALGFLTSLLLARILTTQGYGIYVYAAAWASLLIGPATLGFDRLLVRQMAIYRHDADWPRMNGLVRQARLYTFLASLLITIVACIISWLVTEPSQRELRVTICVALLSIPVLTLISVYQATAQGLKRVVIGQLPVAVIRPAIFLLLLVLTRILTGVGLGPSRAMAMNVAVTALTLLLAVQLVSQILPEQLKTSRTYETENWTRAALPLVLLGGLYLLNSNVDILLLGSMRESREVAIYNVANRLAELLTFALFAVSVSTAPAMAELWARRAVNELQDLLRRSVIGLAAVSIPLALALVVLGHYALGLFGSDFVPGYSALVILTGGQLINALTGSVGLVLVMTNFERDVITAHALGLFLNVVLCLLLIPRWGVEGTAVARTCSLIFCNVFLAQRVHARLGIKTLVFG